MSLVLLEETFWKDMSIIFMKTGGNKTCQSCDYDFSEIVNMKEHTKPVHIEKRLDKIYICDHAYIQKK